MLLLITFLDWLFADFGYIRIVDRVIIASFGLAWLLFYWFRRDFFER